MSSPPSLLLINPWITDFAAHDLWGKPLGLLHLASLLREGGCRVSFIDCLDRSDPLTSAHPEVVSGRDQRYGTGKLSKMPIPVPQALNEIPRPYHRYGIHPESLRQKLLSLPRPDLVWVTSIMTYWYPGVQQTIAAVRDVFPETPVWLGGIYAGLCHRHALHHSGAHEVVTAPPEKLPDKIKEATGFMPTNKRQWSAFTEWPRPALDLLPGLPYAPLLTSLGCPYHCPYCASNVLQPRHMRRSAPQIEDEIRHWHEAHGVSDFAFYDDALLLGAEWSLKPALESIARESLPVRFHTPNALHIRALTPEWCRLLRAGGFTTLRLGLETTRPRHQREWGGKVETEMFLEALDRLDAAGFARSRIGVYLLCGLPGQSPEEVAEAVEAVRSAGSQPYLAEYSPIPGTPMWEQSVRISSYDLENEPLYHNNTFFACRRPRFSFEDLLRLKELARRARAEVQKVRR